MEIIARLEQLKKEYRDDMTIRKNGTILLHPGFIPNCKHMLFAPLKDDIIDEYLVQAYKYTLPIQYVEFLKCSNGGNLFGVKSTTGDISFTMKLITIYGLPMRPPFKRPEKEEEPFDVRIEDLARHDDVPNNWLKCGSYYKNYDLDRTIDIFIDTSTQCVYACEKYKAEIEDKWDSLDECLCSLFDAVEKLPALPWSCDSYTITES